MTYATSPDHLRDRLRAPADACPYSSHARRLQERNGDWALYEREFIDLMCSRRIETAFHESCWTAAACCAAKNSRIIVIAASLPSTSKTMARRGNRTHRVAPAAYLPGLNSVLQADEFDELGVDQESLVHPDGPRLRVRLGR